MARTKLGPLALEAQLGGAQSNTYRAIHVAQRKSLVVKLFANAFKPTPQARADLTREWETLKAMRHEAIGRCYGGGFEGSDAYLAYEWIEGESLTDLVQRRERLPWDLVLDYADQLIEGILFCHDRQVFHGSIEPDKVICVTGGSVKLQDLRVERYGSAFKSPRPPSAFQLAFRAPEILQADLGDDPVPTVKSDLYSLGAVLFYALTGQTPVDSSSAQSVVMSVGQVKPPKVASLVLDCPIWLSALIEQLLEKSPNSRPHGAAAVRLALQEVRRRAVDRTGVADHAAGGFSAIRMDADRSVARQLLGRAEKETAAETVDNYTPLHERWWFLLGSLVTIAGILAFLMWPPSPAKLRRNAEALLATGEWTDWKKAQSDYLEPLLRRDPDGEHAAWAREQIDNVEMRGAEVQLDLKLRRGAELVNEPERLYAEARRYEQFGDRTTALQKYDAMTKVLEGDDKSRPYINLAKRRIAEIEAEGSRGGEQGELITKKLNEAIQLAEGGKSVEARVIFKAIVELYGENKQYAEQVAAAERQLDQK